MRHLKSCGKNRRRIIIKIVNKSPFYWGVGVTCVLLFMFLFSGNIGSATRGPAIHNWSWFGKVCLLIPGILLMINGLFPHSIFGKAGGLIYILISWIIRETKR